MSSLLMTSYCGVNAQTDIPVGEDREALGRWWVGFTAVDGAFPLGSTAGPAWRNEQAYSIQISSTPGTTDALSGNRDRAWLTGDFSTFTDGVSTCL